MWSVYKSYELENQSIFSGVCKDAKETWNPVDKPRHGRIYSQYRNLVLTETTWIATHWRFKLVLGTSISSAQSAAVLSTIPLQCSPYFSTFIHSFHVLVLIVALPTRLAVRNAYYWWRSCQLNNRLTPFNYAWHYVSKLHTSNAKEIVIRDTCVQSSSSPNQSADTFLSPPSLEIAETVPAE